MALEDLKSNLNIGAGKPKSSPSGRHTESPSILGKIDNLAGEGTGGLEKSPTKIYGDCKVNPKRRTTGF